MKNYKKYFILPATPEQLYMALTNPALIKLWTGEDAEMSTEPGSEFSLWEDSISGKNLEFETNRKIVQQWYFGEQEEDDSAERQRGNDDENRYEAAAVNGTDWMGAGR